MNTGRVVEVWADSSYGSGFLVAPGLVLTALHVAAEGVPSFASDSKPDIRVRSGLRIRVLGDTQWWECNLAWPGAASAQCDAALLQVLDEDFPVPTGSVRWGRPTTTLPSIDCELVGFPRVQRMADGLREVDHIRAAYSPVAGAKSGHLQILVEDQPGQVPDPWAGLSGAAVLSSGLITGLVIEDAPQWAHHRLVALPTSRLFTDKGFRAILRTGSGELPPVESVELAPLLTMPPAVDSRATSPSWLLRADAQAVRFRGRAGELQALREWCEGSGLSIRLLVGPGGQGKTRMAHELLNWLQEHGWAGGFVASDADIVQARQELRGLAVPSLLVVDYAETRPEQIRDLVRTVGRHRDMGPIRVLLIARSAGDWWEELGLLPDHDLRVHIRAADVDVLRPLELTQTGRADAFNDALTDLATRVDQVRNFGSPAPWLDFSQDQYERALTLQMEALAHLLEPDRSHGGRSAADVILEHEQPYWSNSAQAQHITLHPRTLRRVVAAASLCGAETEQQAIELLAKVPGLGDHDEDSRLHVACWFRDLYPAAPPSGADETFWGALQPDRLVEHLISSVARQSETLIPGLLRGSPPGQIRRALLTLSRASLYDVALTAQIEGLLVTLPDLAITTIGVAPQCEHPQPLVAALQRLVALTPADEQGLALFAGLSDALPKQTRLFSAVALTVTQILVRVRRTLAEADPESYLPDLAQSLSTLANRLAGAGLLEDAVAAAQEAVSIRRALASADRDAHTPALAECLVTLANRTAGVHLYDEAAEIAEEAVLLYRNLAATEPQTHLAGLAESADASALIMAALGNHEDALDRAHEAISIRRDLVASSPAAYQPDFARSLSTLTVLLTVAHRSHEALDTADQATAMFRALADSDSDGHLSDLANSLDNLAEALLETGQKDKALEPAREAVALRRVLVESHPDAFAPTLIASLTRLAGLLAVTQWPKGALLLAQESVRRSRVLAERATDLHAPTLASALNTQANIREHLGRPGPLS